MLARGQADAGLVGGGRVAGGGQSRAPSVEAARTWKSPQQMSRSILVPSFCSRQANVSYMLSSSPWQQPSTAICSRDPHGSTTTHFTRANWSVQRRCTLIKSLDESLEAIDFAIGRALTRSPLGLFGSAMLRTV